ncbi:MAG: hypothetical protein JNK01_18460 [Devosia sp.]|jgi:hypothetical protein|nr:hypothetical protein [Devosia sp.]
MVQHDRPLYRRVNTTAYGVHHGRGGDYSSSRGTDDRFDRGAMRGKRQRGLDYTPLFKFLLSRVGDDWDEVYRVAVRRLDREEPIYWLVARSISDRQPRVRIGESSYYSGLYVDQDNRLAVVDPSLRVEDMQPSCACCTHTFNGVTFTRKYEASKIGA